MSSDMANDQYFRRLGSVDLWATAYLLNGRTSVISSNSVTTTRAIKIYRSQIKLQFN